MITWTVPFLFLFTLIRPRWDENKGVIRNNMGVAIYENDSNFFLKLSYAENIQANNFKIPLFSPGGEGSANKKPCSISHLHPPTMWESIMFAPYVHSSVKFVKWCLGRTSEMHVVWHPINDICFRTLKDTAINPYCISTPTFIKLIK